MDNEKRTATQTADDPYSLHTQKFIDGCILSINITPFPFLEITIDRSTKDLGKRTESKFSGKLGGTASTLKSIIKS